MQESNIKIRPNRRLSAAGASTSGPPPGWSLAGGADWLHGTGRKEIASRGATVSPCGPFYLQNPLFGTRDIYSNQIATRLPNPTADTSAQIAPISMHQGDLFANRQQGPRSKTQMKVIDQIHGGLGKIYFAARGITVWSG